MIYLFIVTANNVLNYTGIRLDSIDIGLSQSQ